MGGIPALLGTGHLVWVNCVVARILTSSPHLSPKAIGGLQLRLAQVPLHASRKPRLPNSGQVKI